MMHHKKGFTMIELLVVATILAVLAAGAMVSYSSVNVKSRNSKRLSDLEQLRSALEMFRADSGNYVIGTWTNLSALTGPNYIDKLPTDPKSGYTYYYSSANPGSTYFICAIVEGSSIPAGSCPAATCPVNSPPYNYCVKNP
jgi:prepilin-type N-terminal cleavage/methylation domain-containing protein